MKRSHLNFFWSQSLSVRIHASFWQRKQPATEQDMLLYLDLQCCRQADKVD